MDLATDLENRGVKIGLLVTVDAAFPLSDSGTVDRTIPSNVAVNINFFQNTGWKGPSTTVASGVLSGSDRDTLPRETGVSPTGSVINLHGDPNTAENKDVTNVINIQLDASHEAIDEVVSRASTAALKSFFDTGEVPSADELISLIPAQYNARLVP